MVLLLSVIELLGVSGFRNKKEPRHTGLCGYEG